MAELENDRSRLSSRYSRMADLCREYADSASTESVRDELLEMAKTYDDHASLDLEGRKSNGVPLPAPSAFRFADLGRAAGLGAHTAEYGSD